MSIQYKAQKPLKLEGYWNKVCNTDIRGVSRELKLCGYGA